MMSIHARGNSIYDEAKSGLEKIIIFMWQFLAVSLTDPGKIGM